VIGARGSHCYESLAAGTVADARQSTPSQTAAAISPTSDTDRDSGTFFTQRGASTWRSFGFFLIVQPPSEIHSLDVP
jgi:hypothetical protein